MISDNDLAKYCQATYHKPANLYIAKTGLYLCTTVLKDCVVIAARGSITIKDWLRDLNAIAVLPRKHPQLGFCHSGFMDAAESGVRDVLKFIGGRPAILTGHSLGGAEVIDMAVIMLLMGRAPIKVVTFGAPRVGMYQFINATKSLNITQYRRGNDPVPDVPFFIPFVFRYRLTRPQIQIGHPQHDPVECHHIDGYVEDMKGR